MDGSYFIGSENKCTYERIFANFSGSEPLQNDRNDPFDQHWINIWIEIQIQSSPMEINLKIDNLFRYLHIIENPHLD